MSQEAEVAVKPDISVEENGTESVENIIEQLKEAEGDKKLELALKLAEYEPEEARPIIQLLDPTCVDTQEAINIKIGESSFPPAVAYQIFPADFIRGYTHPKLTITLDSVTLATNVTFVGTKYVPKIEAEELEPKSSNPGDLVSNLSNSDSVLTSLTEHMPNCEYPDPIDLIKPFMAEDTSYGDQAPLDSTNMSSLFVSPFITTGDMFIYKMSFDSELEKCFLRRMLPLAYFFIEGSRYPDETDKNWDFYILKHKNGDFIGYSSAYNFFSYTSGEHYMSEGYKVKKRIAQFMIMPNWQHLGIGQKFFLALLQSFQKDEEVQIIVVEDASDEFETLRDRAQYTYVTSDAEAVSLLGLHGNIKSNIDLLCSKFKLEPLQIQRVFEMYNLRECQDPFKPPKLLLTCIKQRLWDSNYFEGLSTVDPYEQRQQLEAGCENVLERYYTTLKITEEEGEEDDELETASAPSAKRAKMN